MKRRSTPQPSPLLLGLLVLGGLCMACLGIADSLQGRTVSGRELAQDGGVLMSCADEPSSNAEPLWCASPDAPHCTRGVPAPLGSEPWLGSAYTCPARSPTLHLSRIAAPPAAFPRPGSTLGYAGPERDRLERPPRRS